MKTLLDFLVADCNLEPRVAQGIIYAGKVFVNEQRIDKPGASIRKNDIVRFAQLERDPSRAADKLRDFLIHYNIEIEETCSLDVGAAHGGFTKVLLERGAKSIICIDVSYGQLDMQLRKDPRVTVFERTPVCHLEKHRLPAKPDFFVADLSFIKASKSLPCIESLFTKRCSGIYLFKPQFEAGQDQLVKGIVISEQVREELKQQFRKWLAGCGWEILQEADSTLKGKKGNRESLFHITKLL